MAFTEFTCRSGGNNLYAGTLDGIAEASTTPLVTYTNGGWNSGTGVYTPASGNPVSAGVAVGNFVSVYTDGASAPTGFVARVTAVSSTTITLSTTAKSGTAPTTASPGITAVVGGAWQGPNGTVAFPFNFVAGTMTDASGDYPRVNFKNDQTYNITATMTHTILGPAYWQGYTATFGDLGKATIDGGTSGASYILLTISTTVNLGTFRDLIFDHNGSSGTANGFTPGGISGAKNVVERVVARNMKGHGISTGQGCQLIECEAYSNGSAGFQHNGISLLATRCIAKGNAANGFNINGAWNIFVDCIADSNTGAGFLISSGSLPLVYLKGCVAKGNSTSGILVSQASHVATVDSCVLASNGAYGVNNSAATCVVRLLNCAFFNNTSGLTNGAIDATGSVTLTADPFNDATNGDFGLNNVGGSPCRNTGRGTFMQVNPAYTKTTTAYPDIGIQHQTGGSVSLLRSNTWDYVE